MHDPQLRSGSLLDGIESLQVPWSVLASSMWRLLRKKLLASLLSHANTSLTVYGGGWSPRNCGCHCSIAQLGTQYFLETIAMLKEQ